MDDEDDEDEDVADLIFQREQHAPPTFIHGKYYLGVASPSEILLNTVGARTFYQFPYSNIVMYLYAYSCMKPVLLPPRIWQLCVTMDADGFEVYTVCDKTLWLRIVQRRWKRVLRERQQWIRQYAPSIQRRRELGQHVQTHAHVPQLRGMLWAINAANTCTGID